MPKPRPIVAPRVPEWVLTYGDLMSLLLCFFILLAAFSELKRPREYERIIESIKEAFGFQGGVGRTPADALPANSNITAHEEIVTMRERSRARDTQNATGAPERITTKIHEGVRFAAGGSVVFAPGSWAISEEAEDMLRTQVTPMIQGRTNKIEVRGHAWGPEDKASGLDYTDLSYRRARAVMDYLIAECGIRREVLAPVAIGNAEPVSLAQGDDGASTANRRVQVIVTEVTPEDRHPDPFYTRPTR